MEINYIKEFITLAEVGNYMEAADMLYISQSTLSRHIQSIENDIGIQLFRRTTRKVELNEYGRTFLPYARKICELQDGYTQAINDQQKNIKSRIKIGALPTMIHYHITEFLAHFREEYPDLHLDIIEADSTELRKMLTSGQIDFAFIRTADMSTETLQLFPYFMDHMVAVFSKSHPLAKADAVSLDQLKNEPILSLPKGTSLYEMTTTACHAAGFTPKISFTGHRAENILDLAGRNMGVGLLTRQPLRYLDTDFVTIVDVVPHITTSICLACVSESSLTPSGKLFLRFYKMMGDN